jgi:hypothetical protein
VISLNVCDELHGLHAIKRVLLMLVGFQVHRFVQGVNADPKVDADEGVDRQVHVVGEEGAERPEDCEKCVGNEPRDEKLWSFLEWGERKG